MQQTNHYKLYQPEPADFFHIQQHNENMHKVDEALAGKASGIEVEADGIDLNTLTQVGKRYLVRSSCQNKPHTKQGHLSVFGLTNGYAYQVFVDDVNSFPVIWYRVQNTGTWGAWTQLATGDDLERQLSDKVNKSGDTMTGVLNIDSSGEALTQLIQWRGNTYLRNKIDDDNYNDLTINQDIGPFYTQKINGEIKDYPLAMAIPPQEFDLPLAAGYAPLGGHKCCYTKTQDGIVLCQVAVCRADGSNLPAEFLPVATLPVGYRPSGAVLAGSAFGGYIKVFPDGTVELNVAQVRAEEAATIQFIAI